ncbi:bifunctional cobalt-precorrin-7 (C(5))-methyltransferase/cobalt-precorrin-6B (C(15))-methyltransferase [Halorhodospira halophila]|uniref:Precorrin-6Y C5,15-methyltransferase (Decarboxylating) n=1 Tax=Halorhodospira halophila (strain DSM 244 / SL1) TaxID=349124 RepID=A1WWQ3_HALHL|nr:bifunctional cobalt-precorrin-7 (C(5))-methyltransferase/cobalt-precorrin-6B (C(15))-methyltransferase [Halorhodospira halophila]ABM62115.1 precorrin-6Y C5,15-methyltransferase (decarboxylating) [Halorhodospira halophila SL1]MBK1729443.1 bifunctional cobalt-precorrin-7 (C(5))-methyltransferase/cobalt-precorrin-6B (C(15))-methyltransferase [Halorhodospira halophila]
MTPVCTIVGVLDDGPDGLAPVAREAIAGADLLIGGRRVLEGFAPLAPGAQRRDLTGAVAEVPAWIETAAAEGQRVVVLASGDPLCHGIGERITSHLGAERCRVLPAPSLVQLACARLGWPVAQTAIASVHGPVAGDWSAQTAAPEHPLSGVLRALADHDRVAVYTTGENGADWLARQLQAVGYRDTELEVAAVARIGREDEALYPPAPLGTAAARHYPQPHVALVRRRATLDWPFAGVDEAFAQRRPQRGLITKREVRAVTLAGLALTPDSRVWDIGTGSGAVALEAARLCPRGHVWAMERRAEDLAIAEENRRRRRVGNVTLHHGRAPQGLDAWLDPDAVFIGGSGGALGELIDLCLRRLRPAGRLVINLVTLENLHQATARLDAAAAAGVADWEAIQLQAHRSGELAGMRTFRAENPVWILMANKTESA